MVKTGNFYQRTNLAILWFFNTTRYCQMLLAYFMYKIIFDNKIDCKYYYNNYIYNRVKASQVLDFKAYNITAKQGIIFARIIKYSNFLFLSEC